MRTKLLLFLILITAVSYGDDLCMVKGGGVLDGLVNQFSTVANNWQTFINPIAKKIFFILFGMEFMWQLTVKKVFAGDVEKLWVFFFTRTVLCFFFAKYLVNVNLYRDLIMYFSALGSQLGGFSLGIGGGGVNTIGPSAVMSNFSCLADSIHTATDQTATIGGITIKFTLAIIQVLLFITLIFIAFYLMRIILQAYLIVYIGFLFAGFAGSSWTFSYWQRYLASVISIGVKFFVVCLIMGVLNNEMKGWSADINRATQDGLGVLMGVVIHVFGSSIIIALAIWQLPEWFSSSITGQIATGLANPLERVLNSVMSSGHAATQGITRHVSNNKAGELKDVAAIYKAATQNVGKSVPLMNSDSNNKSRFSNLNPFSKKT